MTRRWLIDRSLVLIIRENSCKHSASRQFGQYGNSVQHFYVFLVGKMIFSYSSEALRGRRYHAGGRVRAAATGRHQRPRGDLRPWGSEAEPRGDGPRLRGSDSESWPRPPAPLWPRARGASCQHRRGRHCDVTTPADGNRYRRAGGLTISWLFMGYLIALQSNFSITTTEYRDRSEV